MNKLTRPAQPGQPPARGRRRMLPTRPSCFSPPAQSCGSRSRQFPALPKCARRGCHRDPRGRARPAAAPSRACHPRDRLRRWIRPNQPWANDKPPTVAWSATDDPRPWSRTTATATIVRRWPTFSPVTRITVCPETLWYAAAQLPFLPAPGSRHGGKPQPEPEVPASAGAGTWRRLTAPVSGGGSGPRTGSTGRRTQGRTRASPAAKSRRQRWPPNGRPRPALWSASNWTAPRP